MARRHEVPSSAEVRGGNRIGTSLPLKIIGLLRRINLDEDELFKSIVKIQWTNDPGSELATSSLFNGASKFLMRSVFLALSE